MTTNTDMTTDTTPARVRGRRGTPTPAAPPLPAELDALLRRMRLPYLRAAAPDVIATAKAQRWDPAEVLRVLLAEEVIGRDAATRRMRRKTANFPTGKTFATWRPDESSIPTPTQQALSTLEWIGRAENLAVAGPSGTGKSHFVEALAQTAIEADLQVAWFTLETLTTTIGRAKADGSTAAPSPGSAAATSSWSTTSACSPPAQTPRRRSTASSTPPTNAARSRSPATSTRPASTRSCPRLSLPQRSTGSCTTLI
jgi:hypothetical protein